MIITHPKTNPPLLRYLKNKHFNLPIKSAFSFAAGSTGFASLVNISSILLDGKFNGQSPNVNFGGYGQYAFNSSPQNIGHRTLVSQH